MSEASNLKDSRAPFERKAAAFSGLAISQLLLSDSSATGSEQIRLVGIGELADGPTHCLLLERKGIPGIIMHFPQPFWGNDDILQRDSDMIHDRNPLNQQL